jgi:transcriptional regulator with XRE-family HTH domain
LSGALSAKPFSEIKISGIAQSYLSEIENGKKHGSVRALAALGKVLRVDVEDLLAPER